MLGWEFDEDSCWGMSRCGLWRLRTAMLHVASQGWASEDEISSLVGHFTFRALVRRELLATFSRLTHSQRERWQRRRLWCLSFGNFG